MNRIYEFALRLQDMVSPKLTQISARFSGTMSRMQGMATRFRGVFGSATQSVDELRKKLDALKGRRDLMVNTSQIKSANKEIDALQRKIDKLEGKGSGAGGGGVGGYLKNAALGLGVAGALAGVGAFGKMGMDREQTKVAFEQFVGKAGVDPMMGQLNRFADVTPFSNEDVYGAGRTLLSAKVGAGELNTKLTNIGNMSAVSQKDFGEMAAAYAKIKQKGFADSGELHQEFGGTAVMDQLKKDLKVNGEELFKMAEQRKIRFEDIDKAITNLSAKGGLYEGGLDKLSQTAGGKLSTFLGTLENKVTEWAEKLNPILASAFDFGSALLANMQPVEDALGRLFMAFAPLKDSFVGLLTTLGLMGEKGIGLQGIINGIAIVINILATAVSLLTSPVGQLILLFAGLAKGALLLNAYLFVTNAQGVVPLIATFQKLWAVMLANPFTAILVGLVLIGTGIKYAWDNVESFRHAIIKMWEVAKSVFGGLGAAWDAFKNGDFDGLKAALSASWQQGLANADKAIAADKKARAATPKKVGAVGVGNAGGMAGAGGDATKGGDGGVGKAAGLNATTGGTKSTVININIGKLVERMEITAGTFEGSMDEMRNLVVDELLRVVNSSNSLAT